MCALMVIERWQSSCGDADFVQVVYMIVVHGLLTSEEMMKTRMLLRFKIPSVGLATPN